MSLWLLVCVLFMMMMMNLFVMFIRFFFFLIFLEVLFMLILMINMFYCLGSFEFLFLLLISGLLLGGILTLLCVNMNECSSNMIFV